MSALCFVDALEHPGHRVVDACRGSTRIFLCVAGDSDCPSSTAVESIHGDVRKRLVSPISQFDISFVSVLCQYNVNKW